MITVKNYTKDKSIKIANQDTVSYKLVNLLNKDLYTYNKLYMLDNFKKRRNTDWNMLIRGPVIPYVVEGIVSHRLEIVEKMEARLEECDPYNTYKIYECIVPKGAKYYYTPSKNGVISDRIIILRALAKIKNIT